jgi:hypothetical protein
MKCTDYSLLPRPRCSTGRGEYLAGTGHPEVQGRVPVNHAWDEEEPRLLVVEAKLLPGALEFFSSSLFLSIFHFLLHLSFHFHIPFSFPFHLNFLLLSFVPTSTFLFSFSSSFLYFSSFPISP